MFCTHCGNELEQHAKFCSRCGKDVTATAAAQPSTAPVPVKTTTARDWNMHVNILGWLFVGSAILTALLGIMLLFGGRIVSELPMWIPDARPPEVPFGVLEFAGRMANLLGLFTLMLATGIAAAGVGLLQYREWGRVLAIIMCVFMLLKIPLGTAIGIYGLWILLSEQGRTYYETRAAQARA
ncbi:MAG: zinc ribbon domain-containing protein [Acidobacteria bacterium]|nr:zinc ribbon domain-containing protein [Acidobacteriota bacterium]